jgi:hypothetical protein
MNKNSDRKSILLFHLDRQWMWATAVSLLLAFLLFLPYLLAYTTAGPDTTFTGILMNPEDSQTYFGKLLAGYQGDWLYAIPFTPEPHQPAAVGVFYVWLGQLGRALGLSVTAVWHLSRVVAQLILFLTIYWFVGQFTRGKGQRWIAYLLALTGSGLGWLLFVIGQLYWLDAFPVDFKQPGAHIFFTALTYPHIIIATALILFSVWGLWRLCQRPSWRLAIWLAAAYALLGLAYPFLIFLVALIAVLLFAHLLWRERRINWLIARQIAVSFLLPSPLFIYFAVVLLTNPAFTAWNVQAGTPSAPWPHYLVAYGPYLLLGGLYWRRRPRARLQTAVLWLWVLAAALLLYSPLGAQRRFVQGVHVPLSILAALGMVDVVIPRLARARWWQALLRRPRYEAGKMRVFVTALFILFMSLSNLYVFASVSVSAVIQQPDPLFRPTAEIEATQWLRANAAPDAVLLGAYQTGNYVAAHSGLRVVVGHWAETGDFAEKETAVTQFFAADTLTAERQAILDRYDVAYIWHGPRERDLGAFDPVTLAGAERVYQNETISVYRRQTVEQRK